MEWSLSEWTRLWSNPIFQRLFLWLFLPDGHPDHRSLLWREKLFVSAGEEPVRKTRKGERQERALQARTVQVETNHTCLEAPLGVKKFAKDTNPLGPSRGSIQSILGHFWNFATTGFQVLSWFLSRKSVFIPKHVYKALKSQNDSLECCLEWKNTHLLQVWCNFIHNCGF